MLMIHVAQPHLRTLFMDELRRQLPSAHFNVSGPGRPGFRNLLKQAVVDHFAQVRELALPAGDLTPGQRHMLACALNACGTVALVAIDRPANYAHFKEEHREITLGHQVPSVAWCHGRPVTEAVEELLALWTDHMKYAEPLIQYNGTGGGYPGKRTMIVGERVSPWAPYDQVRRLAFTREQGCSLHLHDALAQHARARYYLTNAWKCNDAGRNADLLARELELVRPHHIVAMGLVAQSYLADLRVDFVRTFHPQYWKRFRSHDFTGLAEAVKPDFF